MIPYTLGVSPSSITQPNNSSHMSESGMYTFICKINLNNINIFISLCFLKLFFLLGHDYQNFNPNCQEYDHYVHEHSGFSYYTSNNAIGQPSTKIDGNAYRMYDAGIPPSQMGHEYNENIPTPPSPSICSEISTVQHNLAQISPGECYG